MEATDYENIKEMLESDVLEEDIIKLKAIVAAQAAQVGAPEIEYCDFLVMAWKKALRDAIAVSNALRTNEEKK